MKHVGVLIALVPAIAAADPDITLRSHVGWGATIEPDRVALSTEGGWNGGEARADVRANVEAGVYDHASVFATTSYEARARPSIGAAYQLLDPRRYAIGARLGVAYKPEGFTEPEGEVESVLVLSRAIGDDTVRAMVAYGRDPEGSESDVECAGSYLHRVTERTLVGATARYRRGLALKAGSAEPAWDVLGGAIAGYVPGNWRVEMLVGGNAVKHMNVQNGLVGLVSIGADL